MFGCFILARNRAQALVMSDGAAVPATAAGSTGETDTVEETAQQKEERQFQVGLSKNRAPTKGVQLRLQMGTIVVVNIRTPHKLGCISCYFNGFIPRAPGYPKRWVV